MNSATAVESNDETRAVSGNGHAPAGPQPTPTPARTPTIYYIQPYGLELSRQETVYGACFVAGWILFFAFGLFTPTGPLRQRLWAGDVTFLEAIGFGTLTVVAYTLTNVLFLICFASLIGCMTHRWQVATKLDIVREGDIDPFHRIYFAAALRGFFIYLLFLAGFLTVATDQSVENTSVDQYIRIAGMMSIIGFVLGFDPNLLIGLIRRALNFADPKTRPEDGGGEDRGDSRSGPSPAAAIEDYVLRMDPESFESLRERHASAHRASPVRTSEAPPR